jgi:uncharacterized protein (DUF488 family)
MSFEKLTLYTIGHSTRSLSDFIELLANNHIETLVDIRTIPRSAHNPQFNEDALPTHLKPFGIKYVHLKELGGLRRPRKDSTNTAWKNPSFRGFADYMQTPEFEKGLQDLIELAQDRQVAIMCAEAVPWRCHRSLIGDALTAKGMKVYDIIGPNNVVEHKLTPWAHVQGKKVTYPT